MTRTEQARLTQLTARLKRNGLDIVPVENAQRDNFLRAIASIESEDVIEEMRAEPWFEIMNGDDGMCRLIGLDSLEDFCDHLEEEMRPVGHA